MSVDFDNGAIKSVSLIREVRAPCLHERLSFQRRLKVTIFRSVRMAAEQKATTEEVKMDLFEDDDEFEEFEINQGGFLFRFFFFLFIVCFW